MIPEPASTIKREVLQLIDLQIATFRQESSLDSSQLQDFRVRSKRLRELYEELDRIGPSQVKGGISVRHGALVLPCSSSNRHSYTLSRC
jgi:hypothetical protein